MRDHKDYCSQSEKWIIEVKVRSKRNNDDDLTFHIAPLNKIIVENFKIAASRRITDNWMLLGVTDCHCYASLLCESFIKELRGE